MSLHEALEMAIGALEVTADKLEKDGAWVYETRDTIADTDIDGERTKSMDWRNSLRHRPIAIAAAEGADHE